MVHDEVTVIGPLVNKKFVNMMVKSKVVASTIADFKGFLLSISPTTAIKINANFKKKLPDSICYMKLYRKRSFFIHVIS